jgi:hypothetical protein
LAMPLGTVLVGARWETAGWAWIEPAGAEMLPEDPQAPRARVPTATPATRTMEDRVRKL